MKVESELKIKPIILNMKQCSKYNQGRIQLSKLIDVPRFNQVNEIDLPPLIIFILLLINLQILLIIIAYTPLIFYSVMVHGGDDQHNIFSIKVWGEALKEHIQKPLLIELTEYDLVMYFLGFPKAATHHNNHLFYRVSKVH